MTPEQFCYWLQGFAEMNPCDKLTQTQWTIVRDHLALVFNKVTPDRKEEPVITKNEDNLDSLMKKQWEDYIDSMAKRRFESWPSSIPTWTPNDPYAPSLMPRITC